MDYTFRYTSPLGPLCMASDGQSLIGLWFEGQKHFGSTLSPIKKEAKLPLFTETIRWLSIYFDRKIPDFTPPLTMRSTPFRKRVFEILLTIPYGKTMTYGAIPKQIANEDKGGCMAAQAVGNAVGHNAISLIIPCHRVIGSKQKICGYAGGIERKLWLLAMEQGRL